jgi:hypothetical protein
MDIYKVIKDTIRKLDKIVLSSGLDIFAKSALSLNKRPTFLALSIAITLLPGSNYYLELKLNPQPPFIRQVDIDLDTPANYPVYNENIKPPTISAQ